MTTAFMQGASGRSRGAPGTSRLLAGRIQIERARQLPGLQEEAALKFEDGLAEPVAEAVG